VVIVMSVAPIPAPRIKLGSIMVNETLTSGASPV
jgi:hypothetical protein